MAAQLEDPRSPMDGGPTPELRRGYASYAVHLRDAGLYVDSEGDVHTLSLRDVSSEGASVPEPALGRVPVCASLAHSAFPLDSPRAPGAASPPRRRQRSSRA
eukprot:11488175-Alexandrium_andersonii.AAC.1